MCPPPGGAAVCHRLPARAAGRAGAWGGEERGGPVCEGHCSPCLCHSRLLWLLFLCGYLLQVALCQTHSVTHVHTGPSPGHPTRPFRVCGGGVGASDPGCEVCNDRLGRGGGEVVPWFTEEADKGLADGATSELPFQFLVLKTSLETVSCLPGWGDLRILQRFLGGGRCPPTECSSHLTSLLPFCTCSRHHHPVWGEAGFYSS